MSGNTCPGALLWEMLAADLSAGEWSSLERHMRLCPRCLESLATGRPGLGRDLAAGDVSGNPPNEPALEPPGGVMTSSDAPFAPNPIPNDFLSSPGNQGPTGATSHLSPPPPEESHVLVRGAQLSPRRRTALAVGALAVAVLSLAAAPVRSAAAGLLAQLRVNRVAAVAVGPGDMDRFQDLAGNMDEFVTLESVNGAPVDETNVASVQVADAKEARSLLGFAPRDLDGAGTPVETRVEPGGEFRLRVDGAKVAELAAALGLPTDGVPHEVGYVQVTALPGLTTRYAPAKFAAGSSLATHEFVLQQVPSPTVLVPPDWDLQALGVLYLTALGMSSGEAKALAATIEWGSTLVVPIPAGQAQAMDVQVDGVDGVLFESSGRTRKGPMFDDDGAGTTAAGPARSHTPGAFLVWQKDGMLYALSGGSSADELVAMTENLR